MGVKLTQLDLDFFRWLWHSRQYKPDYGKTWDVYQMETKYIGALVLRRRTSMTYLQIAQIFGGTDSLVKSARAYLTDSEELDRVDQMIYEMVFKK